MIKQKINLQNVQLLTKSELVSISGGNMGYFFTTCAGRAFGRASADFGAMGGGDSATFGTLLAEHMTEC